MCSGLTKFSLPFPALHTYPRTILASQHCVSKTRYAGNRKRQLEINTDAKQKPHGRKAHNKNTSKYMTALSLVACCIPVSWKYDQSNGVPQLLGQPSPAADSWVGVRQTSCCTSSGYTSQPETAAPCGDHRQWLLHLTTARHGPLSVSLDLKSRVGETTDDQLERPPHQQFPQHAGETLGQTKWRPMKTPPQPPRGGYPSWPLSSITHSQAEHLLGGFCTARWKLQVDRFRLAAAEAFHPGWFLLLNDQVDVAWRKNEGNEANEKRSANHKSTLQIAWFPRGIC